jgi:hypothetical protein
VVIIFIILVVLASIILTLLYIAFINEMKLQDQSALRRGFIRTENGWERVKIDQ